MSKKKQYRVFGHVNVVVSTVIEAKDYATPNEIYAKAAEKFKGIEQIVGNGGDGDKMIGVSGKHDTIIVDEHPVFDDFTEEL